MTEHHICKDCKKEVRLGEWPFCPHGFTRTQDAEMAERDATIVFKKRDGSYAYPMRNNAPVPPGCERIVLNSLRKIEQHERTANVRSEVAHFDRGTNRGHDDNFRGVKYN